MSLGMVILLGLGCLLLSETDSNKTQSKTNLKENPKEKYTDKFVREKLSKFHFDNFEAQDIAYKLRNDNWYRQDFESMLRRGYDFNEAIFKLEDK